MRHSRELFILRFKLLPVELDYGGLVAGEVAVVGGAEDSDASAIVGLLIPLLLDLMGSDKNA